MGKSNRKHALETKIALLLGEHEQRKKEVEKAEALIEALPSMRERIWEIETLVAACEAVIKSDHPDWTRDSILPSTPFVHKIPVKLGSAIKLALDVLRLASTPMTVHEIAIEVLRRSGVDEPATAIVTRAANTIGNGLRSKLNLGIVENDRQWPSRWWVVRVT